MDRAWWYELFCITCMCALTTLLMTGYDTQSFVVESILHSVHMREPTKMDKHAGYYGQAVLYGVYTFATLFAPWPSYRLGSKWSLFVGGVMITTYLTSFLVLNSFYFYMAQAVMGIGFAIFYCGQGAYVSEHSTKATITRNSMLIGTIGNCSMIIGGIALIIIFYIRERNEVVQAIVEAVEPNYRDFKTNEIYTIGGVLLGISCLATLLFIALPTRRLPEEGEEFEKIDESTLRTQLARILDTAREPKMILLSAFFVFYGFHVSLLFGYPTTFAFTTMLSKNVYLQAYYSIMLGTGSFVAGVLIAFFDNHIKNFGLIPIQIMQIAMSIVLYFLTIATTANLSTIRTVDDESMWIRPTVFTCCALGFLHGAVVCCTCTMRSLICTIAIPRKRLQAYSLAKLYQSAASSVAFILSPQLTIRAWVIIMAVIEAFSATAYIIVSKQIIREQEELEETKGEKTTPTPSKRKIKPEV